MNNSSKKHTKNLTEHLNALCYNNTAFIKDFVALFKKNAINAMAEINQNNPKKSAVDIQLSAHKLKSNFLLFEFIEASDLAGEIENTRTYEEMIPLIKRLNALFPDILDQLTVVNDSLSR